MTSTIITPRSSRVSLPVPDAYIGRQVEVTFMPLNETKQQSKQQFAEMFWGALSKESAEDFIKHTQSIRKEWEDNEVFS